MDKVQSYEQIQGFVSDIRSLRKGYVSNFFWDPSKHPYWIEEGSLSFLRMDNCVLMIHQQEDFCNLFYIATDMETVSYCRRQLGYFISYECIQSANIMRIVANPIHC